MNFQKFKWRKVMSFNISTLSLSKGELVKVDKLNFLIDYVRQLNSRLTTLNNNINSLDRKIETLKPKKTTIVDLNGRLPIRVPSGGKWMYFVIYHVDSSWAWPGEHIQYAPYAGFISYGGNTDVVPGGSKIHDSTFLTDGSYKHIYVEGFAWRVE